MEYAKKIREYVFVIDRESFHGSPIDKTRCHHHTTPCHPVDTMSFITSISNPTIPQLPHTPWIPPSSGDPTHATP
jgi:hypothetical protein